jgi:hypothetical protein
MGLVWAGHMDGLGWACGLAVLVMGLFWARNGAATSEAGLGRG